MAEEGRDKYLASKAYKRPVGSFTQRDDIREFAGSGPGRNYFAMENLQSQAPRFAPDDPRIDELKQRRRTWNRYQKYPAGEILGRAPQQMQKEYMDLSRNLRQTAKPVYNKMYPLTGGFMDVAEKGGLWGALLSEIAGKTKKGIEDFGDLAYSGITSALAGDSEEEKADYIAKTFGPYPTDIHPGLQIEEPLLVDEEPIRGVDVVDDITVSDLPVEPMPTPDYMDPEYFDWVDKYYDDFTEEGIPKRPPEVIPGYETSYVDRFAPVEEDIVEEVAPPLPPYNDPRTESGIANLMPGGPLYDAIPWKQRLNMRIADEMRKRGPHYREPVTSYYGSNWYDEYKRKMENEMEIAKGIRSPMDR